VQREEAPAELRTEQTEIKQKQGDFVFTYMIRTAGKSYRSR